MAKCFCFCWAALFPQRAEAIQHTRQMRRYSLLCCGIILHGNSQVQLIYIERGRQPSQMLLNMI